MNILFRLSCFFILFWIFPVASPAQTEVPETERELGLTPAARGGDLSWADSLKVESLLFFEKGRDELSLDQRKYQVEFDQTTTRYVAWELRLQHPPFSERHSFTIEAIFYGPEGRELGRLQQETFCESNQKSSIHSLGWGWPDPGFWDEGTYRVSFFIESKAIADKTFAIARSSSELTSEEWLREVKFDYLRFYEKGKATVLYQSRVYRSWFDQQSTRYIAWELHLQHPEAPNAIKLNVQAIYYFPDGRVFGRDELKTWVEPGWPTSWHTSGWGWAKAGYWKKGIYRVEFYLGGQQLATAYFEIR